MRTEMFPCNVIEITTPKKVFLNGLWFGPQKPKRVIIWVHGLGSSMFSKLGIMNELVTKDTAVVTFNNRGHDVIARIAQGGSAVNKKTTKGGAAHEVFTDSFDDIQGAINYARRQGVKDIFLAGHSTGCQKTVYWGSMGKGVKGIIILAPISDYASEYNSQGEQKLKRAEKVARAYLKNGKDRVLLPEDVWGWPWTADAQRFISLYSGDSLEEIFTYWNEERIPTVLRKVRIPLMVLLAEKDEYSDRPAKKIADWFARYSRIGTGIRIIPKVAHGFKGAEKVVAKAMSEWISEQK